MFVTLQAIDVEKCPPTVPIGSAPATMMKAAEDHFEMFVNDVAEVILLGWEDAEAECVARAIRLITDFRSLAKDTSLFRWIELRDYSLFRRS